MFERVLIANRGEIAVRIARACREMGVGTVAVYSEIDARAPHVLAADDAVCIGPPPSNESYLNVERVIEAARATKAEAVHPGYGFLAENAGFARAVRDAGLKFIGPAAEAIANMGDKPAARRAAAAAGVPVAPADENPPKRPKELAAAAARVGYPLLIKAAAGGGGKGMRIVRKETELRDAYGAATREAQSAFGDDRVFLERYIERPRHVEVQILADEHSNVVHLGERECSIQRRHQKIVEETPCPAVDTELRRRMTDAAVAAARSVGYANAGTVEFLLDASGHFYFLEMNTRLQVEHPITELVTGIDIVQAQLRIAAGETLWLRQEDVVPRGHAIECRICAEDPAENFLPRPGKILAVNEPHGPGVRVDSGIEAGYTVPMYYDPLLAKLCTWGETREAARRRMSSALKSYTVLGCTTGIPFLLDVIEHAAFIAGDTHTHFVPEHFPHWRERQKDVFVAALAAAIHAARARRPATAATDHAAAETPWTTLGPWRLGHSGTAE
jgi:acetyl-CoA carboxylase biotin carboxylase subunit